MSSKNISLAYCEDNARTAELIDRDLSRAGYLFEHFPCKKSTNVPALAERLLDASHPILLIISDNFLKSAQCMHRGLRLLQEKSSNILPVVVNGLETDPTTGQTESVATNFDRVSDIIQYINYWQDQYLDLRRQKRQMQDEVNEKEFNAHLKVMREVSSEVGEFLRMLRNMYYLSDEELAANRYERFFRFVEDQESWQYYQQLPEFPTKLSEAGNEEDAAEGEAVVENIPGMDLLTNRSLPDTPSVEGEQPQEIEDDTAEKGEPAEELPARNEPEAAEEEGEMPEASAVSEKEDPEEEEETFEDDTLILEDEDDDDEEEDDDEDDDEEEEDDDEAFGGENEKATILNGVLVRIENEEIETAIALAAEGLERYPDHDELRYHYALLLARHQDDPDVGIGQLQVLLERDPENEEASFLIGELAEIKGDYLLARNYYEKVADLNDSFPDVYYRLGVITINHFPEQKEKAAKYFKRAAKKDPNNADANYQYALLLNEVYRKPKKAIKYFRRTLEIDPNHPFASYDLALLYHQFGERENAFQAYQRATINNPELKTPENDQAFHPRTAKAPAFVQANKVEHDTIEALKANISRLEEILEQRESAAVVPEPEPEPVAKEPGPIVLITGATSGIGRATAEIFAENGYRLLLNGRRQERLEEIKEEFEEDFGSQVQLLPFDVRDIHAVQTAIEDLDEEWRQVDILINNAGKAKGLDPIHEGQLEHWEEMIDTNVKGMLYLTRAISPYMVARRRGHIINVGSTAGKEVYPKGGVYCATKFAVEALTKAMRLDLLPYNIRVSQVSPAHVEETEFALVRFDGDAERAKIYEDFKPLTSSDVAEAIFFMATRPPHVNVQDILMMSTQQAGATTINRSGRNAFREEEE